MTIQLSSLRVAADFDATKYTRGMASKIDADKRGAASSNSVGAALAQADAAMEKTANGSVRLSRALIDGYSNAAKFESTLRAIGRGVDRGMDLDRAAVLLDAAYKKYGLVADAMTLVQQGHVNLAPLVTSLNQRLEIQSLAAERAANAQNKLAVAQSAQLAYNRRLGVTDGGANDARGGDIAAYGRELDNLRAKFNPLYSAILQYRTVQADIRQAHAVGAISADEMSAALSRERRVTLDSIAAIKQRKAVIGETSAGPNRFNTANIAAQLQDIAVTSAMGMSPVQIALQQGTQLSAVFNEMGRGREVIRGLGAAFASIVNPISLVTIGTIAAGSALYQYLSSGSKTKDLTDAFQRHAESISLIRQRYGELGQGVLDFRPEGMSTQIRVLKDELSAFYDAAGEEAARVASFGAALQTELAASFKGAPEAARQMQSAFADLNASIRKGTPDLLSFREAMSRIANDPQVPQNVRDEAKAISELDETALKAARAIPGVENAIRLLGGAASGEVQRVRDFTAAMRELAGIGLPQLDDRELAKQQYMLASNRAVDRASKDDAYLAYQSALNRIEERERLSRLPVPGERPNYESIAPTRMRQSSEERKAERDANAYRDLVKSAQDRIDQMKLEEQLVGKTGVAADAYRMKLDLLQRAQDKGRSVTPEHRKELERLADTYGDVAEKVAALSLAEELRFEREQLFRSATEQRVASTLRSSGIDPLSSQGQILAGQIRLNEQLAENRDAALDFGQSLVRAFDDGKITIEELGQAGLTIMDRLIDKMLNDVVNAIMQVGQAGAGIGGGGGIFGFLGGLFGGGGGTGYFPPAPTVGGGLYAKGGVFSSGLSSFSGNFTNQVVSRPTMFAFAKGVGLMGEADPEAIMPLTRGADGRLGVQNFGAGSSRSGSSADESRTVIRVDLGPDLVGEILQQSGKQTVSIVQQNEENRQNRQQNGDSW